MSKDITQPVGIYMPFIAVTAITGRRTTKAIELAEKLCDVCNLFGYGEITPGYYPSSSTIRAEYQKNIKRRNFQL